MFLSHRGEVSWVELWWTHRGEEEGQVALEPVLIFLTRDCLERLYLYFHTGNASGSPSQGWVRWAGNGKFTVNFYPLGMMMLSRLPATSLLRHINTKKHHLLCLFLCVYRLKYKVDEALLTSCSPHKLFQAYNNRSFSSHGYKKSNIMLKR